MVTSHGHLGARQSLRGEGQGMKDDAQRRSVNGSFAFSAVAELPFSGRQRSVDARRGIARRCRGRERQLATL